VSGCIFCVALGALLGSTIGITVSLSGLAMQGIDGLGLFFLGIPVGLIGSGAGAILGARFWTRRSPLSIEHRKAITSTVLGAFFALLFLVIVLGCVILRPHGVPQRGFWGDL
jgi:hypothetical protein